MEKMPNKNSKEKFEIEELQIQMEKLNERVNGLEKRLASFIQDNKEGWQHPFSDDEL